MVRVTRPQGKVGAYVWDYSGGMEMMRHFWDAAIAMRPGDAALDQAERFPPCQPEPLRALFQDAGLPYAAARLGASSEKLGFDTPMSTDHDWGPHLELLLRDADAHQATIMREVLGRELPPTFAGFPFRLSEPGHQRVGGIDQWCDSTDLRGDISLRPALRALYRGERGEAMSGCAAVRRQRTPGSGAETISRAATLRRLRPSLPTPPDPRRLPPLLVPPLLCPSSGDR